MESPLLFQLYEDYCGERKLSISFEQFVSFSAFYPSLLVISTDGDVDKEEWEYVEKLSESLVNLFVSKHKSVEEIRDWKQTFINEFKYLLGSFEKWERLFIGALRQHLENNPQDKFEVAGAMHLFAEASEDVSEKEQIMIEYLKKELNLNEI
jgi:hypothetical protein